MVEKKVQFNVVVGGIPQIRSSLKGVTESARAMNLSVQQMAERTAQRVIELERNKLAAIKRINDSEVANEEEKARRIAQIEEGLSRQITSIKEREALKVKHMNEKFIQSANSSQGQGGINLQTIGHVARAGGFYKTGHLINIANQLGIGSKIQTSGGGGGSSGAGLASAAEGAEGAAAGGAGAAEGGAAAAAGAGGLAAVAAVAIPVVIALGAVYVAAKLVETGFEVVSTQAKFLAQSFLGAISQIGGAKSLQEMLVEASEKEAQTKITRFTVLPGERLSEKEIQDRANALAARADLGAPDAKEGIAAQKQLSVLTGMQKSITPGTLEFIARMSHLGGMSLTEGANIYGRVAAQNPGAEASDIQDLFLSAMAIGQKGSFSVADIPQATGLIQAGAKLAGNPLDNTRTSLVAGTILRPRAGDLTQAGTQYDAFIRQAELSYVEGKLSPTLSSKYFNKKGQLTDVKGFSGEIVSQTATERARPFARAEAQDFLVNMQQSAGITDTDTKEEQKKKIAALWAKFDDANMSMQDFVTANNEAISTQDKLRAQFNQLADKLEAALLPVLQELVPQVETFAKAIIENKDLIAETVKLMVNAMMQMVPTAITVAAVLARLGIVFGMVTQALAIWADQTTAGVFHEQLEPFIKAGESVAKSQAALALTLDNLKTSFEDLKGKIDKIETPVHESHGATATFTVDPINKAADNLHHAANKLNDAANKLNKQPDW